MPAAKKSIRSPILPKDLEVMAIASLEGADLERCRVEGCALSKETSEQVRFDAVSVVGGSLSETLLQHLNWLDVRCERCDLSMIVWPRAKLTRVEIRECRVTGAKVLEGELDEVRFVECQLDYA